MCRCAPRPSSMAWCSTATPWRSTAPRPSGCAPRCARREAKKRRPARRIDFVQGRWPTCGVLKNFFAFYWRRLIYLAVLVAVAGAATYYVRERRASEPQDAAEQSLREQEIRLRDALGKAPTDVHLRLELAEVELKLGEYPEAEVDAQRAAREGAPDDDVAPVLAEATLYQGKLPLLLSRVAPGKRPPKAESRVRAALGLAHLERREFADAQRLLQEAARLDPDALGPHLGLVRALLAEDHAKEAEAELARARSLGPDHVA